LIVVLALLLRTTNLQSSVKECGNNKLQSRHQQDQKVSFKRPKKLYPRTKQ